MKSLKFIKIISWLLIQAFLCEQLAYANPDLRLKKIDLFGQPRIDLGIPESIANIEESYAGTAEPKIYLIQDAHTNFSGQINLAKTLEILLKKEKALKTVFIEAGVEDNSLTFLKKYGSRQERERMALPFVREGRLQGEEYLSLTGERDFTLWGVENLSLYKKAIEDYRYVAAERGRFETYLSQIQNTINTLKSRLYDPALFELSELEAKYYSEKIPLTDYFDALQQAASGQGVNLGNYPALSKLRTLKGKESSINFAKAAEEQQKAVESLNEADQKELVEASKAPSKLGAKDHQQYAYFSLLENVIARTRQSSVAGTKQSYPELKKYFDYIRLSKEFKAQDVLTELKSFEEETFASFADRPEEKHLLKSQKIVRLLNRLFSFTLTPDDYKEYQSLTRAFGIERMTGFLNYELMKLGSHYERALYLEPGAEDMIRKAEDFYNLTYARDLHFITETLRKMDVDQENVAVLITGGFHSPNLKSLLKSKNISYVSLTPQVLTETNHARYEKLLLGQETLLKSIPTLSVGTAATLDLIPQVTAARFAPDASQTNLAQLTAAAARMADDKKEGTPEVQKGENSQRILANDQRVFDEPMAPAPDHSSPTGPAHSLGSDNREYDGARAAELDYGKPLAQFDRILKTLPLQNRRALDLRFGIFDGHHFSYAQIASELGVSQRKAKSLVEQGLRQLRHPSKMMRLGKLIEPLSSELNISSFLKSVLAARAAAAGVVFPSVLQKVTDRMRFEADYQFAKEISGGRLSASELSGALNRRNFLRLAGLAIVSAQEIARRVIAAVPPQILSFYQTVPADWTATRQRQALIQFLTTNVTESTKLALSYWAPEGYWAAIEHSDTKAEDVMERLITTHGQVIYDGAVWQTVMALEGKVESANGVTQRLLSGRSGTLNNIRGYYPFKYGDARTDLMASNQSRNAFFFRIIADKYNQGDPKTKSAAIVPGYPEGFGGNRFLHHEDWKPITGENAWAAIIGPLQTAFIKYQGKILVNSDEVRLALSILPAIEAMRSPFGAIYHAPEGTEGKDPRNVSTENNASMLSALRMLLEVLPADSDEFKRVETLVKGIETYFRDYALDTANGVFYQGGHNIDGQFRPNPDFAVDCQTWTLAVLGVKTIDGWFGDGAARKIWQETKRHAGYFDARQVIRGVGFTDGHEILSSEWTFGAILMAREAARDYKATHSDWAAEFEKDAASMREGVDELKVLLKDGRIAYLYCNKRTWIPFGWWGNPIPSLAGSTWVILTDKTFNPFVLGGKSREIKPRISLLKKPAGARAAEENEWKRIEDGHSLKVGDEVLGDINARGVSQWLTVVRKSPNQFLLWDDLNQTYFSYYQHRLKGQLSRSPRFPIQPTAPNRFSVGDRIYMPRGREYIVKKVSKDKLQLSQLGEKRASEIIKQIQRGNIFYLPLSAIERGLLGRAIDRIVREVNDRYPEAEKTYTVTLGDFSTFETKYGSSGRILSGSEDLGKTVQENAQLRSLPSSVLWSVKKTGIAALKTIQVDIQLPNTYFPVSKWPNAGARAAVDDSKKSKYKIFTAAILFSFAAAGVLRVFDVKLTADTAMKFLPTVLAGWLLLFRVFIDMPSKEKTLDMLFHLGGYFFGWYLGLSAIPSYFTDINPFISIWLGMGGYMAIALATRILSNFRHSGARAAVKAAARHLAAAQAAATNEILRQALQKYISGEATLEPHTLAIAIMDAVEHNLAFIREQRSLFEQLYFNLTCMHIVWLAAIAALKAILSISEFNELQRRRTLMVESHIFGVLNRFGMSESGLEKLKGIKAPDQQILTAIALLGTHFAAGEIHLLRQTNAADADPLFDEMIDNLSGVVTEYLTSLGQRQNGASDARVLGNVKRHAKALLKNFGVPDDTEEDPFKNLKNIQEVVKQARYKLEAHWWAGQAIHYQVLIETKTLTQHQHVESYFSTGAPAERKAPQDNFFIQRASNSIRRALLQNITHSKDGSRAADRDTLKRLAEEKLNQRLNEESAGARLKRTAELLKWHLNRLISIAQKHDESLLAEDLNRFREQFDGASIPTFADWILTKASYVRNSALLNNPAFKAHLVRVRALGVMAASRAANGKSVDWDKIRSGDQLLRKTNHHARYSVVHVYIRDGKKFIVFKSALSNGPYSLRIASLQSAKKNYDLESLAQVTAVTSRTSAHTQTKKLALAKHRSWDAEHSDRAIKSPDYWKNKVVALFGNNSDEVAVTLRVLADLSGIQMTGRSLPKSKNKMEIYVVFLTLENGNLAPYAFVFGKPWLIDLRNGNILKMPSRMRIHSKRPTDISSYEHTLTVVTRSRSESVTGKGNIFNLNSDGHDFQLSNHPDIPEFPITDVKSMFFSRSEDKKSILFVQQAHPHGHTRIRQINFKNHGQHRWASLPLPKAPISHGARAVVGGAAQIASSPVKERAGLLAMTETHFSDRQRKAPQPWDDAAPDSMEGLEAELGLSDRMSRRQELVFLVNVHNSQKKVGSIALGDRTLTLELKGGKLYVQGLIEGKEIQVPNFRMIETDKENGRSEVQVHVSMSDLQLAVNESLGLGEAFLKELRFERPVIIPFDLGIIEKADAGVMTLLIQAELQKWGQMAGAQENLRVLVTGSEAAQAKFRVAFQSPLVIFNRNELSPTFLSNAIEVPITSASGAVKGVRVLLEPMRQAGDVLNIAAWRLALVGAFTGQIDANDTGLKRFHQLYQQVLKKNVDLDQFVEALLGRRDAGFLAVPKLLSLRVDQLVQAARNLRSIIASA